MQLKKKSDINKPNKINPKDILKERKSYADSYEEDLELKGVVFYNVDNGNLNIDKNYLVLPKAITEVSMKDLGEHLNALTQQKIYMRTLFGWADCMMEEAKDAYLTASTPRYKKLTIENPKMSETAKEKDINSEPDIFPLYQTFIEYEKKMQIIKSNILSLEEAIFMVSREISRRTGDWSNENRNYNVNR